MLHANSQLYDLETKNNATKNLIKNLIAAENCTKVRMANTST